MEFKEKHESNNCSLEYFFGECETCSFTYPRLFIFSISTAVHVEWPSDSVTLKRGGAACESSLSLGADTLRIF